MTEIGATAQQMRGAGVSRVGREPQAQATAIMLEAHPEAYRRFHLQKSMPLEPR